MTELSENLSALIMKPDHRRMTEQLRSVPLFLHIFRKRLRMRHRHLQTIHFYFYAASREDAFLLRKHLQYRGHSIQSEEHTHADRICIRGQSHAVPMDDLHLQRWIRDMNELAFIHNCEFDGWEVELRRP